MTVLGIMAAIAAALVLACRAGVLPVVREGARDANFMFKVTMRAASDGKYLTQPRAAVLAQELAEWLLKWLVALAIASPAVWLLARWGLAPAGVLAVILAHTWPRWPGGQRQLELVGHMIEAEAAMKLGYSRGYIAEEARRTQPAYPCFADMTVDQVMAGMLRRRWLAKLLLAVVWRRARRLAR